MRSTLIRILTVVGLAVVAGAARAQDAGRLLALIVANANYPDGDRPVPGAAGDAHALAGALRGLKFAVTEAADADLAAMRRSLDGLVAQVRPGAVVVIAFSGYGIQSGRQNYLLPVDSQPWTEPDVQRTGVSVTQILSDVAKRGATATYLVLDAAHKNPFERRFRSYATGLAPLSSLPRDTAVIYSTAPGAMLRDAAGAGEGFGPVFVRQIAAAGHIDAAVFDKTRATIEEATSGAQVPWTMSSFAAPAPPPSTVAAARPAPAPPAPASPAPAYPAPAPAPVVPVPVVVPAAPASPAPSPIATTPEPPAPVSPPVVSPTVATTAPVETATAVPATPPEPLPIAPAKPAGPTVVASAPEPAAKPPAAIPAPGPATPPVVVTTPASQTPSLVIAAYSVSDAKVLQTLNAALAKSPKDVVSLYTRGQLYAAHNDVARAQDDFDQVLRINPADIETLNNRCWVRALLDQLDGALADCNAALRLRPGFLDALDSRGFVELKKGQPAKAITDYDAALKIDARHASALYGRGLARNRTGDAKGGDEDMRAALSVDGTVARDFASYGLR